MVTTIHGVEGLIVNPALLARSEHRGLSLSAVVHTPWHEGGMCACARVCLCRRRCGGSPRTSSSEPGVSILEAVHID
jgi:hypothetical protein